MTLIESLNWRYATKKFDPIQKIDDSNLMLLKESIRLTATSYGLQLFKVLDVRDQELREKLRVASWGQSQITDASHMFVFCSYRSVRDADVDRFIELKAKSQGVNPEVLAGYGDFMKKSIHKKESESIDVWVANQVYIALGNLLAACAELRIDSCPMEGFEADEYDEILGLENKNLRSTVVATMGYRDSSDPAQSVPKVRKAISDLFETV